MQALRHPQAFFLFLAVVLMSVPLATAQQTQSISVWTSEPVYHVGDTVTVLWDTNGPCVQDLGVEGSLRLEGPSGVFDYSLSESTVQGGIVDVGTAGERDLGSWLVILRVVTYDCSAEGSTTFLVSREATDVKFRGNVRAIDQNFFTITVVEVLQDPSGTLRLGQDASVVVRGDGQIVGNVRVGSFVEVFAENPTSLPGELLEVYQSFHYVKLILPETTIVYVYSLPLGFLGQDPASAVGSDLHATVSVQYVLNEQSHFTTLSTPFRFEADVDSEVFLGVASSPADWEFSCIWEDYGYARHDSCSLRIQVVSETRKVTAFFREKMQPCDYSLSANPPRIAVQQGSSTSIIVTVSPTSGSCGVTTLSISSWGGSSGLSANFRPTSGTPPYDSAVEISALSVAGKGTFTILIAASGPVASIRSTSITVTVTAATAPVKTEMPDLVPVAISAGAFATISILASLVGRPLGAGKVAGQALEEGVSRPLYDVLASADKYRDEDMRRRVRRTRELVSLGLGVLIVGSILAYSESRWPTQGTIRDLLDLLPNAVIFASTVLLASHVARLAVADRLGERIEYRLSAVAVLGMFVTALLKAPFGSPGDVSLRKGTFHAVKAKISLAAMAAILAASGIFYLLLRAGLPTGLGVYFGLTLAAASAIPARPLTGHSIYQYNRKMSAALLIVCFYLLFLFLSAQRATPALVLFYLTVSAALLLGIVVLYPERALRPRPTKRQESQFQFCMNCGAPLPGLGAGYCGRCGARQQYPESSA